MKNVQTGPASISIVLSNGHEVRFSGPYAAEKAATWANKHKPGWFKGHNIPD